MFLHGQVALTIPIYYELYHLTFMLMKEKPFYSETCFLSVDLVQLNLHEAQEYNAPEQKTPECNH